MTRRIDNPVEAVAATALRIPTDRHESDGTLEWDSTGMVIVEVSAGGRTGLGYSYSVRAAAEVVRDTLTDVVLRTDAMDVPAASDAMTRAVRNLGRPGVASAAISAVDAALWDLKAMLLDVPLVSLLGAARREVPVYGSGGFTSYTPDELAAQLGGWVESGIPRVKMKVGRDPPADAERVRVARRAIGPDAELFVDANGAYTACRALAFAQRFAESGVTWLEEPVSSDDLDGLRFLRGRAPPGMAIAAGEYGHDARYFRRMLAARAVDVLQADATRCGGITGFLHAGAVCEAFGVPLSAHTAPSIHAHACCALRRVRHLEFFHDHARIERLVFDGFLEPEGGSLHPDLSRPGLGITLKRKDMEPYAI